MANAKSEKKTDWIKMKPEEIEKLVVKLAKQNISPEKIGLILRDQHGIPKTKIFGKKMSKILKENKIDSHNEKENISKKVEKLKKHFEKHKHDYYTQRAIVKYRARLRKLTKN